MDHFLRLCSPRYATKVHLQGNRFEHDLPPSFFECTSLADVNLADNYLSGAVSDDVANLTSLRLFRLDGNRHSEADRDVIRDCMAAYLPTLVKQAGFKI